MATTRPSDNLDRGIGAAFSPGGNDGARTPYGFLTARVERTLHKELTRSVDRRAFR